MTDYSFLNGKKILITGATGLIGKAIISFLLTKKWEKPVTVIALVRDESRAKECFATFPQGNIKYLICDVCDLKAVDMGVDYIVHGANFTRSKAFVTQPVDVIACAVKGTENILNFARLNGVKSLVYLSSMEVYGASLVEDKIYENSPAYLDCTSVRSSYPESKRVCECLCVAYCSQYGVPAKIVRLTQTFGEGVAYDDKRVFAEFARCVIEGRDIILKTKGETQRNYLYIGDAIDAIFTVLSKGGNGEAYNVANEDTYCSIMQMAQLVAGEFGGGKVSIKFDFTDSEKMGYAPPLKMNLSTQKINSLGWVAQTNLKTIFEKTIESMKQSRKN